MATAQEAIAAAAAYRGYVESGGSTGHNGNVTIFWAKYKPSFQGQPWCAIYQHAIQDDIGMPLPFLYTYTPDIIALAKRTGRHTMDPQPGDIADYWNGEHTGLVASFPDSNGYFYAWEGNTSPSTAGSQSNGGGVYLKRRHLSDAPDGFYRPPYATSEEDTLTPELQAALTAVQSGVDKHLEALANDFKNMQVSIESHLDDHINGVMVELKAYIDSKLTAK